MEIAEFLLARIAEDEAAARAASFLRPSGPDPAFVSLADGLLRMQQRFGPARVLADCEAKRRIVEECRDAVRRGESVWLSSRVVLPLLALPYVTHPDYQPEWNPLAEV